MRPLPAQIGLLTCLALAAIAPLTAGSSSREVEIVTVASFPELRVHGRPFFVHSAAFFYYRIPRGQWSSALDRHRQLGLNTIDLYIPWNWHEPAQGQLDFDGHSNPQRDLRRLLGLLRKKNFSLIARPGPVILNEWRNGGYPDWLLKRPEFEMPLGEVLEGRYPPLSGLGTRHADEAARRWLANPTHLRFTRRWFAAVAVELERFRRVGGILLAVQLDDDQAIGRTNVIGPNFWRYMETLRQFLVEGFGEVGGRFDVPVFFNPTDPRLPAAGFDPTLPAPIAVMGQWYQDRPRAPPADVARLVANDRATIQFFAETLALQPAFPPMIIEFQAGWYAPGDDAAPMLTDPRNMLLAARLLFAHGLRGLSYFPAQDTLTPAGYEVPWTNRSYAWDAALALDGRPQPRAASIGRNGGLLRALGPWLAATHKHADMGLVYPLSSFEQAALAAQDVLAVSRAAMRLAATAVGAGLSTSYVDAHYQPDEALARYRVLLLPVFEGEKFRMSEHAAKRLENYVRRGGRLVVFPQLPLGPVLARMFAEAGITGTESGIITRRNYAAGEIVLLRAALPATGEKAESENAILLRETLGPELLRRVFEELGGKAALRLEVTASRREHLDATLLTSNGEEGPSFIALTNADYENSARIRLSVAEARGQAPRNPGEVFLPAADSLFLPLRLPLCAWGAACEEKIVSATAELTGLWAEEGELITIWYAPSPASATLRLAARPERVRLDGREIAFEFDEATNLFRVSLPPGKAPLYSRELRVATGYEMDLPAPPAVPEAGVSIEVANALSFPVRAGAELPSAPALVPLAGARGWLEVVVHNRSSRARRLELDAVSDILAPARSTHMEVGAFSSAEAAVPLRLKSGVRPGLYRARLRFRSKLLRESVVWLAVRGSGSALAYRYDLDRDGFPDWVAENDELQVVVSPAAGARSFVLEEKRTGRNWFTPAGALRDHFAYYEQPPRISPERLHGQYGLHNRAYNCEPIGSPDGASVALRCRSAAPDVLPAGAEITKTITLEGRKLTVDYEIHLREGAAGKAQPEQAFIAVASLSAEPQTAWGTGPGAAEQPTSEARVAKIGEVVELAGNELRLEVPGGTLLVHFEGARGTLERKVFSAWLKMRYPPLASGSGRYRCVYEISAAH